MSRTEFSCEQPFIRILLLLRTIKSKVFYVSLVFLSCKKKKKICMVSQKSSFQLKSSHFLLVLLFFFFFLPRVPRVTQWWSCPAVQFFRSFLPGFSCAHSSSCPFKQTCLPPVLSGANPPFVFSCPHPSSCIFMQSSAEAHSRTKHGKTYTITHK